MFNFLKVVPLFADLPDADLERLCENALEVVLPVGEQLFAEGSAGDRAYIIEEGELEILKTAGGREVLLAVRRRGEVIGEMALLEDEPRTATVRARVNSRLLPISSKQLDDLLSSSPAAARAMLNTIMARWRNTESMLRQSEKMAQLGTLTAGVAHELNNPAAAAARAASQLGAALARLQDTNLALNAIELSAAQYDHLGALGEQVRTAAAHPAMLNALAQSDLEYELETWLEDKGVENAWELTPALANLGFDTAKLEDLTNDVQSEQLPAVIRWLDATYNAHSLLVTVGQGAERISEIVKSLKTYSYLDQAPVQNVDITEGLDNTLIMLKGKLKAGITVERDYANDLPRIEAYGSELNQVWTNIIDNAADAMNSKGHIWIRAKRDGPWIVVEIEDDGPGIPPEVQPKIFDPFFTTKPPGKGTGLGLNISYNIIQKHWGEITVSSRPGKTMFQVKLPVNRKAKARSTSSLEKVNQTDDASIVDLLEMVTTVAVVGISANEERPAYSIPAYLKEQGYHIVPVNPNIEQVLGEKAYPDLTAIREPIDLVLIFRKSEAVPPIVDEAIKLGIPAVWMTEGVVNEQAARTGRDAGLTVIMDRCMRNEHRRLILKV